jgi:hypothetical protein
MAFSIIGTTREGLSMNTQLDAELEKTIIDFGTRNGYPVFYVLTEDEVPPASYFNGVKVSGKMHMFRLQAIAAAVDFAEKNNGILVRYDGPLPAFCRSHHCTERGPKCDKCAYTAFSSSHRRWLEGKA